ncbi:hypothetical protein TNCV_4569641 [Trichonephila clavipes]|nr:hypothetical protein TNCV_4569641 [Trichonephila clavipes]
MENRFNLGDFRKIKRYDQKVYKLPHLTSAYVPAETNKRPLEEQPGPSSKRNRVFITTVIRPPAASVLIARLFTALPTPHPVSIPEPSVLTTPQILLPDPPVQIPVFQPPVQIPPVPTTPSVQIPDPPVQIPVFQPPVQIPSVVTTQAVQIPSVPKTQPVQLFLPDLPPVLILLPPVVETLEPTLTDDSSIDQICRPYLKTSCNKGFPGLNPRTPVA